MNTQYIDDLIDKVLEKHTEFSSEEVREICNDFLGGLSKKCKKEATREKLLRKYISSEFDLEGSDIKKKVYSLNNIPKYLYDQKSAGSYDLVNISSVTKILGKTELLERASAKIGSKDKIALIGKNGSGKTTLLKMIVGLENPDDGEINIAKNLKIGYLTQELFWNDKANTLRQEMMSIFPEDSGDSMDHDDLHRRVGLQTDILFYFGFKEEQLDLNVLNLSGGEQTKVQIAKFLIQEIDLLVLDEPTNHLDIEGIIFLEKFCKLWNKGLLCISHDVKFINSISNEILEISGKKLHLYKGDYQSYLEQKQEKYDRQLKDHTIQKRQLDKQERYIDRFRYKASKAAGVQSRIKMVNKIERITKPEDELKVRDITLKGISRMPNLIIRLTDLQVGYQNPLIKLPECLEMLKNQKIGIIGKNGAGKTTLLNTMLGLHKPLSGDIYINESINVGSYSQVFDDIDSSKSILDELQSDSIGQKEIRSMLGGLLISGEKVMQSISTLSGGEKAKVALTKMLLSNPQLIVMDEPTNHLDLSSKNVVKNMLEGFEGNVLLVSHDRDILESIVDIVWVIKDNSIHVFNDLDKGFDDIYES